MACCPAAHSCLPPTPPPPSPHLTCAPLLHTWSRPACCCPPANSGSDPYELPEKGAGEEQGTQRSPSQDLLPHQQPDQARQKAGKDKAAGSQQPAQQQRQPGEAAAKQSGGDEEPAAGPSGGAGGGRGRAHPPLPSLTLANLKVYAGALVKAAVNMERANAGKPAMKVLRWGRAGQGLCEVCVCVWGGGIWLRVCMCGCHGAQVFRCSGGGPGRAPGEAAVHACVCGAWRCSGVC
jgi:hypothetical protein